MVSQKNGCCCGPENSGPVIGWSTTVRRPDGRSQVTYRGLPLYSFNEDRKPGDTKGQGFKDVGTWLAATTVATRTPAPAPAAVPGYSEPGN